MSSAERVPVVSPATGRVVPMGEVPDPVFAESMVGPGLAVVADPGTGTVTALSPVPGTVVTMHPHAFVVTTDAGPSVLVHLGIDTVKLAGEGFTVRVAKGEQVRAGQPMVEWDPDAVVAAGYSACCPVVALDAAPEALGSWREPGPVFVGDELFRVSA